jgi:replicative DNA helicase
MRRDLPPDNALDAEAAVIGSCLAVPEHLDALAWLPPEAFFDPGHRRVLGAMRKLREAGTPADLVTLAAWLRDHGQLADVGGINGLGAIVDGTPIVADVAHYARLVQQAHQVRQLERAALDIASRCRGAIPDRPSLLAEAGEQIAAVTRVVAVAAPGAPIGELVGRTLQAVQEPGAEGGNSLSGFEPLDRATTGFAPGDLWVLAARPGMGKTALACNLALNLAFTGRGVMFFSLEMPAEQIAQRAACSEGRVDMQRLRTPGALTDEDWAKLDHAHKELRSLPLWVDDSKGLGVHDLLARAAERKAIWAREAKPVPLSLVVVDYLQLLKTTARKDRNREQEVAEVSRALKAMAGTLKCPVLALAQLSRESEKQGRRPRPSDLRDSGQVEQDADGILFLHRDKETPRGCVDVIIAKQRQGQVGTFALAWWPRYMRFDGHMDAVSGAVQGVA